MIEETRVRFGKLQNELLSWEREEISITTEHKEKILSRLSYCFIKYANEKSKLYNVNAFDREHRRYLGQSCSYAARYLVSSPSTVVRVLRRLPDELLKGDIDQIAIDTSCLAFDMICNSYSDKDLAY